MVPGRLGLGLQEPIQCLRFVTYVENILLAKFSKYFGLNCDFFGGGYWNMKLDELHKN